MRYFRLMEFSIKTLSPETAETGCIVLGVHAEKELTAPARRVDQRSKGALAAALADLSGKVGSTLLLRALPNLAAREAFYRFDELKSQKKSPAPSLGKVTLPLSANAQLEEALAEAEATADGADLARTLGNLPSNICTPSYLAEQAKKLAREFKLDVEVLERRDIEKLGMGAFLAVTKASREPPKLIVLRYNGG